MGLDPTRTVFYRQSDIPELFELTWVFECFTSKGWMNKAHAYKAHVADAEEKGLDPDATVNMGTYSYPILMAADIIAFDVDLVPVGKDQVQHVEIARDIAQRINHVYGGDVLRLPQAKLDETTAIVPGLDGRKMSKSYGNTIPLFAPAKQLKKIVNQIVTDSSPPETPKDPESSTIFQLFKCIATPAETAELAARYRSGIGWGDAKKALIDRLEAEVGQARVKYDALMAEPAQIDALLLQGAEKARTTARAVIARVRRALGITR
jgi:tryptophanyl-tRNA synthetase